LDAAVSIPTTFPLLVTSGPPESPGSMGQHLYVRTGADLITQRFGLRETSGFEQLDERSLRKSAVVRVLYGLTF
jgi:hypothetical protein